MNDEMTAVSGKDELTFQCSPDNSCFNDCCRDLNQFLTPYDILRLKNNLEMHSSDFLRKYTSMHKGPETGLPVISFKPDPAAGYACPFVTEKGCAVYHDRPGSCRLFPLARAISRSRETGKITEHYALIHDPGCKGFGKASGQTVQEWIDTQDVGIYNKMNDRMMEIITLKNTIMPGKLEGPPADAFYLACYDLDNFRKEIFENGLMNEIPSAAEALEKAEESETELLKLGFEWIKYHLFGNKMNPTP